MFNRILKIELPPRQSAFLWGARKTGKSTLLKRAFPHSRVYDFLDTDIFFNFSKQPSLLREQLLAQDASVLQHPVILDEVQKVPLILDEVQWLIENRGLRFIMCGSSARKLKRGRANLLGGRAWRFELFPLIKAEVPEFDLLQALNRGMIPDHYTSAHYRKSLRAYTRDYLKEEVFDEGLTRNIPAFSRFFDAIAYSHGELTNYSNIARDCGVDSKTVKEYYQILVDTLLGTMVTPFHRRQDRHSITKTPKFYLFDVGVAGALIRRTIDECRGEQFGRAFEHFIGTEILAHRGYSELDYEVNFWRTKSGQEVDFILGGGEVAVEVKGTVRVDTRDLHGLQAFVQQYRPRRAIVVCTEREKRRVGTIEVLPWQTFLEELQAGEIIR